MAYFFSRRVQAAQPKPEEITPTLQPSISNVTEVPEPVKEEVPEPVKEEVPEPIEEEVQEPIETEVDSLPRAAGDYIDVQSRPYITKFLQKQGDRNVHFADQVLKLTGSGKMKRRILLLTDFAIYMVEPETDLLKRRIALATVETICLSTLNDNFLAVIIPPEYDLLMASTRKAEIVKLLVEAIKSTSNFELEVSQSNRFEYHAAAEIVKEIEFEEVEGGVRTRILQK